MFYALFNVRDSGRAFVRVFVPLLRMRSSVEPRMRGMQLLADRFAITLFLCQ